MKLLLDTHALLWLVDGDQRLTKTAREAIMDPASTLTVSVATIWELAIKTSKPQQPLILREPLELYLKKWLPIYGIDVLPVEMNHAIEVSRLPDFHRDPFDRILVAQAACENMDLVTGDRNIASYSVTIIW